MLIGLSSLIHQYGAPVINYLDSIFSAYTSEAVAPITMSPINMVLLLEAFSPNTELPDLTGVQVGTLSGVVAADAIAALPDYLNAMLPAGDPLNAQLMEAITRLIQLLKEAQPKNIPMVLPLASYLPLANS